MNIFPQQHDTMRKVAELVKGMNTCMLTAGSCGRLISHPMNPLELDKDGDFWFFSSKRAAQQLDLSFINIAFADEERAIYISLSGKAELSREQYHIDRLWTPGVKPWFVEGKDDPDLFLMSFTTHTAAYWDTKMSRMTRLLAAAAPSLRSRSAVNIIKHEVLGNSAAHS